MLTYGHDTGKCSIRGSNTANVAQFASGSSAPVINPASAMTTVQCTPPWRLDNHSRLPTNPIASGIEVKAMTIGQLSKPRNGRYGEGPGLGLVVRGSPCKPICMFAMVTTANSPYATPKATHASPIGREGSVSSSTVVAAIGVLLSFSTEF